MDNRQAIPDFALYGETTVFPDVVHCEKFSTRAPIHDWRISRHRHTQIAQLFMIEQGRVRAWADACEIELCDGDFLYVPAQTPHEFCFQPGTAGLVVSMPTEVMRSIGPTAEELLQVLRKVLWGAAGVRLQSLVDLVNQTASGSGPFRAQAAVGLVHAISAEIASRAGRTNGHDARLAQFDGLILSNMAGGWTVSDYARAMAISTGHLSRICRTATGLGANAYIERAAMIEACRMLAFTRLPVSEIGFRLGFSDPSYFAKRFKAAQGRSPRDYRQQFAG